MPHHRTEDVKITIFNVEILYMSAYFLYSRSFGHGSGCVYPLVCLAVNGATQLSCSNMYVLSKFSTSKRHRFIKSFVCRKLQTKTYFINWIAYSYHSNSCIDLCNLILWIGAAWMLSACNCVVICLVKHIYRLPS